MAKYEEWINEEGLAMISHWKRHGLSNKQVAENMGITEDTFYKWVSRFSEFAEAIKKGRTVIVNHLENALVKRALEGDTTALIFALKNMDAEHWRDRKETAVSGSLDTTKEINVNFVKADKDER